MQSTSIQFFENLMSPNKEIRENAEKDLEKLKTLPPLESLKVFEEGMSSPKESTFQLATLMLKKVYLDNKEKKESLTDEEKNALLQILKSKIDFNKNWKSLQRIADALAPTYQITSLPNGLSEIMNWFNNQNDPKSRKFAFYIIEVLCDLSAITEDVLDSNAIENFKIIFTKGLDDNDIDVKVSSLNSATQFLSGIVSENIINNFSIFTDKMLQTLIDALKYENEKKNESNHSGKTALETMNNIIERHPKFWKEKIELIIDIVCQISKGKIFQNQIRESALELIFSLAKKNPGSIKKSNNFKTIFLPLLFELLYEIDNKDNIEKWEKQKEEDEVDLDDMYYAVRDSFERLSIDLGDKFFMQSISQLLKNHLTSQNWIEVHAGYTALAYMSEGCKESFKSNIEEILNFISQGLTYNHPRVRYVVLSAFGLIVKETSPLIQQKYTNNILPALALLMGEKESSIRVKTQSCNSLVEFIKGLLNDKNDENNDNVKIIQPYANDLVSLVSNLFEYSLQVSYPPLQEASLTCISLLSNLLEKDFAPYYEKIMPGLKKLFYNYEAKTQDQKTLKSNCIETISFLCSSVAENRDKYMNDLVEISDTFIKYLSNLPEEDPQLTTLLNSFTHLSHALKEQFTPILEQLLPYLNKCINADIGLKVEDANLSEYIPEDETEDNQKIGSLVLSSGTNSTKLSLHTFVLQNKVLAFTVLNEIANNMGKYFFKYSENLLNLSKNLLSFPFSRKIRKVALKSVSSCINSCETEEQKKKIIEFIGNDINLAMEKNIKQRILKDTKANLKGLTAIFGGINDKMDFTEEFIKKLYENLGNIVKSIDSTKNEIIDKVINNKTEDEEEENELALSFDNLNEINRRVMEVNGIIFKLFKEPLTALVTQNLYDSFLSNWQNDLNRKKFNSDQEILSSICFFDDYMEYSDLVAFNLIVPIFINNTFNYNTKNEDIIQSTVYGYGVICQRTKREDFTKIKDQVMTYIVKTVQREVNDDTKFTFDNAVGAMGKMIYYQLDNDQNGLNMSSQLIKLIPLSNDLEESKSVCDEFFKQIANNNPIIVNETNIPLIKDALGRIKDLNDKEKFLEDSENTFRETCVKFGM